MKLKKLLIGAGIGITSLVILITAVNTNFLGADLFFHTQTSSQEEILIPTDFVAEPGEIGEIALYAGESFPTFAREDVIGFSFDISWDSKKAEFLSVSQSDSIFSNTEKFELLPPEVSAGSTSAHVIVWTGDENGTSVKPGDRLGKIMFQIRDNTVLGDEIVFPISNAEIVYDGEALKNYKITNTQDGILRVGDPSGPFLLSGVQGDFFFDEDTLAQPGEERRIVLRAGKAMDLAGFAIDMNIPASQLTFLEATTKGTKLEKGGFELIVENSVQNHLGVLGATGSLFGTHVKPGDPILALTFLVNENIPLGTQIPLKATAMEMVKASELFSEEASVDNGSIKVSKVSSLRVVDTIPLSSSSIRIVLSDDITSATLDDISFYPPLKNRRTSLEIEGNTIVVRSLTTMIPGEFYRVDLDETITGNIAGTLSPEYNFGFFLGFPANYPTSHFWIESAEAISATEILLTFSDAVNPESIETPDFTVEGLSVISVETVDENPNQLKLNTTSQVGKTGSMWIRISNISDVHDLQSDEQELLSLNVIPFTPYGLSTDSPEVVSVSTEKPDLVNITFDKPLLGSSIMAGSFKITQEGKTANLVPSNTYFDLSADHLTVTLHNVKTLANKTYRLQIAPGELRGNDPNALPVETIGNLGSFFGQGNFFTPWDFGLESAEATASDEILLTFSEEVSDENLEPLNFMVLTRDSAEFSRGLDVISATKDQNTIHLKTEAQTPGESYFVLVDPEQITSKVNEMLGIPSSRGFLGYAEDQMRAISAEPRAVNIGQETEITITGLHFPEGVGVRAGLTDLNITSATETEVKVRIPNDLMADAYDIIVSSPEGFESRIPNAFTIIDPNLEQKMMPKVLSAESYASPYKVPNDNSTPTTLWVLIEDPRGVSDIEKVTADLRQLNGEAARKFELHEFDDLSVGFVNNKAWYKMEITVPSTVPTSKTPVDIPVTVENKTGRKGFGSVSLLVNRDLESSIPPEILSATASPKRVSPGDPTEVSFHVEVMDEDGAENIARVVLDATEIGLGIRVLQPLPEIQEDRECVRTDYVVGEWSACIAGNQTRTVDLKPGVECSETGNVKPDHERVCSERVCTSADWQAEEWSACVNGKQTRDYIKKPDSFCTGDNTKPPAETKDCTAETTSFLDDIFEMMVPKAQALTVFGNKSWYQSSSYQIPEWIEEGTYELPLTVIDREGTETSGTITLEVARNTVGSPQIDDRDIFISPDDEIPNDGKTEFQIFAKVSDPNGYDDIVSTTLNLSPIGLPPINMEKGQVEGNGIWYASPKLVIPTNILPGHRSLSISVTDTDQNMDKEEFPIYITTPDTSGEDPYIPVDKAFSNPRVFINDESTIGTLYVFVEKGDADIAHVSANLGTIAKYIGVTGGLQNTGNTQQNPVVSHFPPDKGGLKGVFEIPTAHAEGEESLPPETNAETGNEGNIPSAAQNTGFEFSVEDYKEGEKEIEPCVSTDTVVCLIPSVTEGGKGQWFYAPNLVARKDVLPSENPYFVNVVATDTKGKKAEGEVGIFVSDGSPPPTTKRDLPYLVDAVPISRTEVEAIFSSSLDHTRIKKDAFKIVFFEDRDSFIPIKDINIRADGRSVILRATSMNSGNKLTLLADSETLGLRQSQRTDNQANFTVYSREDEEEDLKITSVSSTAPNGVKVNFNKDIKFSSLLTNGENFTIWERRDNEKLPVHAAIFENDAQSILVATATQRSGAKYIIEVDDIIDFTGKTLKRGANIKSFIGYKNISEQQSVLNQADFNQDGKIDFSDFSIFSTVYGINLSEMPDASYSDLNGDGKIDFVDFSIFSQQYGSEAQAASSESTNNTTTKTTPPSNTASETLRSAAPEQPVPSTPTPTPTPTSTTPTPTPTPSKPSPTPTATVPPTSPIDPAPSESIPTEPEVTETAATP